MLSRVVEKYADLPGFLRKRMWKVWHDLILNREKDAIDVTFMNYGYTDEVVRALELEPADEQERICAHLYHKAAAHADLTDLEVLEVGCGRGGGASYMARYLGPRSLVGLDLNERAIAFCSDHFRDVDNLHFRAGDAEALPFADGSFDAVVNVESSRCYPNVERFFAEVHRVLRPGGHFLLTDMRWAPDVPRLREQLGAAGFTTETEEDISARVVEALDADNERRRELIRRKVPGWLVSSFDEFAGVAGSGRHASFADGTMQYWSLHLTR